MTAAPVADQQMRLAAKIAAMKIWL